MPNQSEIDKLHAALARVRLEIAAEDLRRVFVPADCSDPVLYRSCCSERIDLLTAKETALVGELERAQGQLAFALDE